MVRNIFLVRRLWRRQRQRPGRVQRRWHERGGRAAVGAGPTCCTTLAAVSTAAIAPALRQRPPVFREPSNHIRSLDLSTHMNHSPENSALYAYSSRTTGRRSTTSSTSSYGCRRGHRVGESSSRGVRISSTSSMASPSRLYWELASSPPPNTATPPVYILYLLSRIGSRSAPSHPPTYIPALAYVSPRLSPTRPSCALSALTLSRRVPATVYPPPCTLACRCVQQRVVPSATCPACQCSSSIAPATSLVAIGKTAGCVAALASSSRAS